MLAGKPYAGVRADLFSLGVTLYAMLCGCFPRTSHFDSSFHVSSAAASASYDVTSSPMFHMAMPITPTFLVSSPAGSPSSTASGGGSVGFAGAPQFPPHVPLSPEVRDLLQRLLQPSAKHRLNWSALVAHKWLNNALTASSGAGGSLLGSSLPAHVSFGHGAMLSSSY